MKMIFRPDPNEPGNADTYIANADYANTNFAGGNLDIGTRSLGKGAQTLYQALLRFDISPLLGAKIIEAKLRLTANVEVSGLTNQTFTLHKVLSAWDKFAVNWNSPVDFGAPLASTFLALPGDLVFDVTNALTSDFDVLIKGTASSGFEWLECYSASADVALRPVLDVTFEPGVIATPPPGGGFAKRERSKSLHRMLKRIGRKR
jgi:hypothetical protein